MRLLLSHHLSATSMRKYKITKMNLIYIQPMDKEYLKVRDAMVVNRDEANLIQVKCQDQQ